MLSFRPAVFLVLLLPACQPSSSAPLPGHLVATWDGADRGGGRMTASATWCARDSILEFLAREGDRGVGVALHLASAAPAPGRFGFVHPETEAPPRPAATGAWRFMTDDALHAYVSRSGEMEVTEVGDSIMSGRLTLRLVARAGPDTILVQGSFADVPLAPARTPCGIAPRTPAEIF